MIFFCSLKKLLKMKPTKKTNTGNKSVATAKSIVAAPAPAPITKTETTQPASPTAAAARQPSPIAVEFVKPDAKSVCIAGSFNEWKPEKTPLTPTGNGRWVAKLNAKPGRYEYLFVVDGQWLPDPNAPEQVRNPYGGTNSVLIISE